MGGSVFDGATGIRPSTGKMRGVSAVIGLVLGLAALAGCGDIEGDRKEDGMLGLFKSRKAPVLSRVAPEVGAPLVRQSAFPERVDELFDARGFGDCWEVAIEGRPPAATFVEDFAPGESVLGYRIGARDGVPPLALFDVEYGFEVWELDDDGDLFVKARSVQLVEPPESWFMFHLVGGACLPGRRLALAVNYLESKPHTPPKTALYVYDTRLQQFRLLAPRIEADFSEGLPYSYFQLLAVGPSTALLHYGTDWVRVAAETYANSRDHLVLFSPRHPQGLKVLDLSLDDGNVRRWGTVGKTLWLETEDIRPRGQPARFVWSLDLSRVL